MAEDRENLKTRGDRLRWARRLKFTSASEAARSFNIPVATYNSYERADNGGRGFDAELAAQFARRLGVSDYWLLTGRGSPYGENLPPPTEHQIALRAFPGPHIVRVVGYVGANSQEHRYSVGETDLDEVSAPPGASDKTVALEIRGVSLGKPFDRWLVFYDDVRQPVTDDLIGELCVIGLADERTLVKKLTRSRKPGLYDLVSLNEDDVLRDQSVAWAALVVALSRKR